MINEKTIEKLVAEWAEDNLTPVLKIVSHVLYCQAIIIRRDERYFNLLNAIKDFLESED